MKPDAASVHIDAPPEAVWEIVSDVTRMGEISPICKRCEWLDGADGPAVGARFRGHNERGLVRWSRECVVTESEPGRVFAFTTYLKGRESTRWRYAFEPDGSGTRVTESYEPVSAPAYVRVAHRIMGPKLDAEAKENLERSLGRLKAVAESARSAR